MASKPRSKRRIDALTRKDLEYIFGNAEYITDLPENIVLDISDKVAELKRIQADCKEKLDRQTSRQDHELEAQRKARDVRLQKALCAFTLQTRAMAAFCDAAEESHLQGD